MFFWLNLPKIKIIYNYYKLKANLARYMQWNITNQYNKN